MSAPAGQPQVTVLPADESASSKIRDKIKGAVLPRLQQEGKDPASKEVYPNEVKELAKEFKVDYNTAKKAWDKVLREVGAKPAPPQVVTKQVGEVKATAVGKPKVLPPPEQKGEGWPVAPEEEPVKLPKEAAAKLFAGMHRGTAEFLCRLAEAAWGVKVERPDVKDGKTLSIDDESNPYYQAGSMWAEVIDAYDIEMNKVLVLMMATVNTGQVIATPLLIAQGEKRRIEAEKKEAEAKATKEVQPLKQ